MPSFIDQKVEDIKKSDIVNADLRQAAEMEAAEEFAQRKTDQIVQLLEAHHGSAHITPTHTRVMRGVAHGDPDYPNTDEAFNIDLSITISYPREKFLEDEEQYRKRILK